MRSRTAAFAGLVLGAGAALVASAQPWWNARAGAASVGFTGAQTTGGLAQALGLAGLAGVLLLLTLGRRGRRILAGLLLVVGGGMVALGLLREPPGESMIAGEVKLVALGDAVTQSATAWPVVYAVAGGLVALAAGVVLLRVGTWPQRADRFTRESAAASAAASADLDDPTQVWKALDVGIDPTGEASTDPVGGPDVHIRTSGDTMGR